MADYDKLRGLVGQSMGGLKAPISGRYAGSFSYLTAAATTSNFLPALSRPCILEAFLWGAGGGNATTSAGGGAEAVWFPILLLPGLAPACSVYIGAGAAAADGEATTFTLNGQTWTANGGLTAGNGRLGGRGGGGPGAIVRRGGDGATGGNAGLAGEFGFPGGLDGATSRGGGGGAGGFSDWIVAQLFDGTGQAGSNGDGSAAGRAAGAGGSPLTRAGGPGAAYFFLKDPYA